MTRFAPPLMGFNNNVKYRGHRFHIQTEDSGPARPHLNTHLFADGGHIVKTVRTDYTEYFDHPDRAKVVRDLMKRQHIAMAVELRSGRLDHKLVGVLSEGEQPAARQASAPPARGASSLDVREGERNGAAAGAGLEEAVATAGEAQLSAEDEPPPSSAFRLPFEESLDDVILHYLAATGEVREPDEG